MEIGHVVFSPASNFQFFKTRDSRDTLDTAELIWQKFSEVLKSGSKVTPQRRGVSVLVSAVMGNEERCLPMNIR